LDLNVIKKHLVAPFIIRNPLPKYFYSNTVSKLDFYNREYNNKKVAKKTNVWLAYKKSKDKKVAASIRKLYS